MNILYFLGNGFDLQLGLKTSYKDFYDYYTQLDDHPTEGVKKLRSNIKNTYENWSDLEIAIGEYTEKTPTPEEFIEIRSDIIFNLSKYLKSQERKPINHPNANFIKGFVTPEYYFREILRNQIDEFKNQKAIHTIDIITFNYTNSLSRVFPKASESIFFKSNEVQYKRGTTLHIHGTTNRNMVLGVNDKSQIKNSRFKTENKILKALIKERVIENTLTDIDKKVNNLIINSDLLCFYGTSFGDTDKRWWLEVGKHLQKNPNSKVILFSYQDIDQLELIELDPDFLDDKTNEVKEKFMNVTNNHDIKERIFVCFNRDVFKP